MPVGVVKAQCILSNPSFEITGSGGAVFGGWNQFGACGWTDIATHGAKAARVSGPATGSWAVSGYWQSQDCAPGERWRATGQVRASSGRPLDGSSTALVNIEWRDAAGGLIDYESFTVADSTTHAGAYFPFDIQSGPAPAGTAETRILLGTLQGPDDPVADVYFDQITFFGMSSPTMDELQWNDFPGDRVLVFAGRTWRVKGSGTYGPGPNVFTDDPQAVWVDAADALHLTLARRDGIWQSTEVVLEENLGYGDYIVTTVGDLGALDAAGVLGLFLWQYGPCWDPSYLWWNPYNEIDIEYGRWNDPANEPGQFVAQPYDWPGNLSRFDLDLAPGDTLSSAMRWLPDRVEYRVWQGGPQEEASSYQVASWTYYGPHLPRPEQPRLHLNLWRLDPAVPSSDQEVVISEVRFVPEDALSPVPVGGRDDALPGPRLHLKAAPNPFNPTTTLRFFLPQAAHTRLDIYDVGGRRVATLRDGTLAAGRHEEVWHARGNPSGVYFARLQAGSDVEVTRLVLLK